MDQIDSQSQTQMCSKHQQKKVKFIQVNELSSSQNNPLFYCTNCINQDLEFKGINYLLIPQIIEEGEKNIIQKWPPVNDYSVIEKLIQFTERQDSSPQAIHEINEYFTHFKEEFLRKIDLCQKKMINRALELPIEKEAILEQYKQISQISKLRNLLIEGKKEHSEAHEQSCRQFISDREAQKQKNSELLQSLLEQCCEKERLINFDYPNLIKKSIFSFVDKIEFFNQQHQTSPNNQASHSESELKNSSRIMKLISNKSNFCSTNFLTQLSEFLENINPMLSNISFESMHEPNKSPLDFSGLNQVRLDLVQEFVEHQTKIEQKNREYLQSIESSLEYKYLEKIIDSRVNCMDTTLKGQLKEYLIDTYPLLKKVNFSNVINMDQTDKFNCFRQLSEIEVEDYYQLIKKKQFLDQEHKYNLSQTKQVKRNSRIALQSFENADEIIQKYPIFDLMKNKDIKENLLDIKLLKTNRCDGKDRLVIEENCQVSINQSQYRGNYSKYYTNCVSNIILEKDLKYIFRFQIQTDRQERCFLMFGFMQNRKCDTEIGRDDKLTCQLKLENQQISHEGGYGIDKHSRGDKLKLSNEREIEMRVWLRGQQLDILDYPHYQYKVEIKDEYRSNLISFEELKFYIGLGDESVKVTLTSALLVHEFPN